MWSRLASTSVSSPVWFLSPGITSMLQNMQMSLALLSVYFLAKATNDGVKEIKSRDRLVISGNWVGSLYR